MKPLSKKLRKNGYNYVLVHRDGKVCIYEQGVAEDLKYYEVFIIKIKPEHLFKGKVIEAHEVFAKDEDFGKTAWTCRTLDDAMVRFKGLVEKDKEKGRSSD